MEYTKEELLTSAAKGNLFDGVVEALSRTIDSHPRYKDINHVYMMYDDDKSEEVSWFPDYEPWMNFEENANQALKDISEYIWEHGSCRVSIVYERWTKESFGIGKGLIEVVPSLKLTLEDMIELGRV